MPDTLKPADPLLSFEFLTLSLVAFLAFCNLSIFYGFNAYLEGLGVPPAWRGVLLSLEPGTAFVLRPFISPLLTLRNSVTVMGLGLVTVMAALIGYSLAGSLWGLAAVRVLHGCGFVLLISAVITVLVHVIPRDRSGQAFGVFAITSLLPYAVLPPLVERLLPLAGSETVVYAWATPLLLPALLLLAQLGRRVRRQVAGLPEQALERPKWEAIAADLRIPGVSGLLLANLMLFTATTVVFFYMKDHLLRMGAGNAGVFYTTTTAMTIGVRIFCGKLMDRVNRAAMLTVFLFGLALCFILFGLAGTTAHILASAALYGVCLGFVMPQMNAAMFVISPFHLRGLNSNLMMFTMDGGYFLGPLLAGLLLAGGTGYGALFLVLAALPALSALITLRLVAAMGQRLEPTAGR